MSRSYKVSLDKCCSVNLTANIKMETQNPPTKLSLLYQPKKESAWNRKQEAWWNKQELYYTLQVFEHRDYSDLLPGECLLLRSIGWEISSPGLSLMETRPYLGSCNTMTRGRGQEVIIQILWACFIEGSINSKSELQPLRYQEPVKITKVGMSNTFFLVLWGISWIHLHVVG